LLFSLPRHGRDGAAGDDSNRRADRGGVMWTLDYQSDEDTGNEGELELHEKTTGPYFVLETDDVIELRGMYDGHPYLIMILR
jgi:hypothetical protein